jgi:CheY-like chemotaxis protein
MIAQKTRILHIEDNPANIRLVEKLLKPIGYDLINAEDGNKGLIEAVEELPNIILLDVNLPSIDGITVLRSLKTNPVTKDIPVVMYTAQDDSKTQQICKEYGADAFLSKFAGQSKLLRVINRLIPATC